MLSTPGEQPIDRPGRQATEKTATSAAHDDDSHDAIGKCLDPPGFGQAVIDGVAVDHAAYF